MKSINVTELKAHLSRYLRQASRGTRIIVKHRDEPVAELGPLSPQDQPWRDGWRAAAGSVAERRIGISSRYRPSANRALEDTSTR